MERADGDAEAGFGSGVGGVAVEGRLVEVGALGGLAVGEGVAPEELVVTVAGVNRCPLGSCWTRAIVLPARGVPVEVALRVPERVNSRLALGVVLEAAMDRVVSSTDNEASPTA